MFCVVRDEHTVNQNWLYSNAIGGVKLEVVEEDLEKAKEILNLPPEQDIILSCPFCGSANTKMRELSVLNASLLLFLGLVVPSYSVKIDCFDCMKSFRHKLEKAEPGDIRNSR